MSSSLRSWAHGVCWDVRLLSAVCVVCALTAGTVQGQINLIHQEGFNDDGDGTRYTMIGRGQEVLPVGPGMWEHSFNVDVIGLPAIASEKRAAILWTSSAIEDDFTEDSLMIWDNLINYMIDDKQEARIGFFPNNLSGTADFLSFRLEDAGHTALSLDTIPADPSEVDLIIQTEEANPDPGTLFATFEGTGYPVPVITFNAGNHDDTLISSIGAATSGGPTEVSIVEANQDHPILGGKTGTINWVDPFLADTPLQGIGASTPAGSKVLATYEDGGLTLPALVVVEKGDPLLGAFAPIPEGTGFIVGGDMNERFPDELGEFTSEANPRQLILNPVDISGETGVKVSVGLAATDVDFESPDFLQISYGEDPNGEFTVLARFDGMAPGVLTNPELGALNPNAFTDYTFEIPDEVNNLVVKFEAFSTFPNEVLGIDNVRIFTGEELVVVPLDCSGDGVVDIGDLDCTNEAGETAELVAALNLLNGDLNGDGKVDFSDFLVLSTNFNSDKTKYTEGNIDGVAGVAFGDFLILSTNFNMSSPAGAASVPEPSSAALLTGALLLTVLRRRRRN